MTGIASSRTPRNDMGLVQALAHLRSGGVLVYPTETSYALGCDATNTRAVAAVFRAKGRTSEKSLSLIVASVAMAKRCARWPKLAERLARAHWPGPLTLVLARRSVPTVRLARGCIAGDGTVALRVSAHPVARALCRRLGRPIVSTSANRAGAPAAFTARAARTFARASGAMFFDGGDLRRRKPSTIVDVTGTAVRIVRRGSIRL